MCLRTLPSGEGTNRRERSPCMLLSSVLALELLTAVRAGQQRFALTTSLSKHCKRRSALSGRSRFTWGSILRMEDEGEKWWGKTLAFPPCRSRRSRILCPVGVMTEKTFCSFCFQDAAVEDAVLRKKEQKDVELDKKILALRKKNEALIRRYQVSLQVLTFPSSSLESSACRVKTMASRIRVMLLHRYKFHTGKCWEQVGRALPSAVAPESHWEADSMTCRVTSSHPTILLHPCHTFPTPSAHTPLTFPPSVLPRASGLSSRCTAGCTLETFDRVIFPTRVGGWVKTLPWLVLMFMTLSTEVSKRDCMKKLGG